MLIKFQCITYPDDFNSNLFYISEKWRNTDDIVGIDVLKTGYLLVTLQDDSNFVTNSYSAEELAHIVNLNSMITED